MRCFKTCSVQKASDNQHIFKPGLISLRSFQMTLPARWLTDQVAVAPQLTPGDVALAAAEGFKTIICNRPDQEGGPYQPCHYLMQTASAQAGLSFAYLPVAPGGQTPEEAQEMGDLMAQLPKPILAYCRSGNRCIGLISLTAQLGLPIPR